MVEWKGREGKGREGKGREGKGREGKGWEGKGREGKYRRRFAMLDSDRCKGRDTLDAIRQSGGIF